MSFTTIYFSFLFSHTLFEITSWKFQKFKYLIITNADVCFKPAFRKNERNIFFMLMITFSLVSVFMCSLIFNFETKLGE